MVRDCCVTCSPCFLTLFPQQLKIQSPSPRTYATSRHATSAAICCVLHQRHITDLWHSRSVYESGQWVTNRSVWLGHCPWRSQQVYLRLAVYLFSLRFVPLALWQLSQVKPLGQMQSMCSTHTWWSLRPHSWHSTKGSGSNSLFLVLTNSSFLILLKHYNNMGLTAYRRLLKLQSTNFMQTCFDCILLMRVSLHRNKYILENLRGRCCRIFCKFHLFWLDIVEALLTVNVSATINSTSSAHRPDDHIKTYRARH